MLLWRLIKEVDLLPPSINDLQIGRFLKNGKRISIFFSKIAATKPLSGLKIRLFIFGTYKNPQICDCLQHIQAVRLSIHFNLWLLKA